MAKNNRPLSEFARQWLTVRGHFSKRSDYEGKLGRATMEVIALIENQDHSGASLGRLIQLFNMIMLAWYKPVAAPTWTRTRL